MAKRRAAGKSKPIAVWSINEYHRDHNSRFIGQGSSRLAPIHHSVGTNNERAKCCFSTVGTFVGMLFQNGCMRSAMENNSDGINWRNTLRATGGKLATLSKIAQCVGTLRNPVSSCNVMDLGGC